MHLSISSSETVFAKHRLAALVALFAGIIMLGLGAWQAIALTPVSSGRYLAAAEDHVRMLERSKGAQGRIVLLGGSGTAFSVSAEDLSARFDRPIINGGIQAGIGMRNLIDLYAPQLDPENDLIVLLPEPELLTGESRYSQVWCDVLFLRKDIAGVRSQPRCVPNILHRTWQEARHHVSGADAIDPVYRRSGFNRFGDLVSHLKIDRPVPDFSGYDLPDIPPANVAKVAGYARQELIQRGFEVLYIPAAMPEVACERSPERVAALLDELGRLTTGGPVMRDVTTEMARFCLASDLFFDGAGHLNATGRIVQTESVAAHLAIYLAR
jgi:hypothetical protein